MGTDDTRHIFLKSNEGANLTAQFGALPSADESVYDDNTQALFAPIQQTCTEAFFAQIHENNAPHIQLASSAQNKDVTVS
jgi:hypothetical protein